MAMRILLIEPYDTGSHATWMRGYQVHSQHQIDILSLDGQYWQWRFLGGAVPLAREFIEKGYQPDLIVASDMLDLTTFLALTRPYTSHVPTAIYFHENQLTYPVGPRQKQRLHFAYMNYLSALAADGVFFNSKFHLNAFFDELPRLLKHYPDYNELHTIDLIRHKSTVLPVGLNLSRFDAVIPQAQTGDPPLVVWNHRWDFDKNPQPFLNALYQLAEAGLEFEVVLAGENLRQEPSEFLEARNRLGECVIHFGYVDSFDEYARYLKRAHIVVSTAIQDFFGISIVEGIYCGAWPVLANRLNYPYLVPAQYHADTLFNDNDELLVLLKKYLKNPRPAPVALRDYVTQFDWQHLAPRYDKVFSEITRR